MLGCFYMAHVIDIPMAILNFLSCLSIPLLIAEIYLCFANKETKLYRILNPATFYVYPVIIGLTVGKGFTSFGFSMSKRQYQLLINAFINTCAIFTLFSLFALLTNKRIGIYIGTILGALFLGIINIFVFNVMIELVIGIIIECLYIIADTQAIIHECNSNNFNVFSDAKRLFIDFARLLIKLMALSNEKEKEEEKKKKK